MEEVAQKLTDAEKAKVTSQIGTDIELQLGTRKAHALHNICHESGTMGSPPDIEAYVAILEDTANGVINIDGTIILPEFGLLMEPVELTVESGNVVTIEGGDEAERFRDIL